MGYYKVSIRRECDSVGCTRTATYAVKSSGTVEYGRYCSRHADFAVKHLAFLEKSDDPT